MASIFHLALHILVPGLVARLFFPSRWKGVWMMMLATMVVDLDHLLSDPIYAPDRCSIGFHPLHQWPAILSYCLLLLHRASLPLGVGLLIHMALDTLDCLRM